MSSSRVLPEIGKALVAGTDIGKMLPLAMDKVIEQTGAERGMIVVYGNHDELLFETARALDRKDIEKPEFQVSKTIMQRVQASGKYEVIKNALEEDQLKGIVSIVRLQLLSVACAPLRDESGVFGIIYIDNRRQEARFDDSTGELLAEFADLISVAVRNALEHRRLAERTRQLEFEAAQKDLKLNRQVERWRRLEAELTVSKGYGQIKGRSPAMMEVFKLIEKVAATNATVLILGETGTGKELIAREMHRRSLRRDQEFVTLNCSALAEQLLESELFGHEKGAFTGADKQKIGYFEYAGGGTIFLDEIGKISKAVQVKLLRVVQSGEFNRLGSEQVRKTDVRIIAAASPDLPELIKQDKFFPDLYFRLKVIEIRVPPLRERRIDILDIAGYFRERYARRYTKTVHNFSPEACDLLVNYDWPGNVRELENTVERAVILTDDETIQAEDLPHELHPTPSPPAQVMDETNFAEAKKKWERDYICVRLKEANGNVAEAARRAGMFPSNFHQKMKQYGITREDCM
jgi:transcriptional regulator with GAF, ATPase, and Fis domain